MFELLKTNVDFRSLTRPDQITYHRVYHTTKETGAPHFLHGVAIEEWNGRLAVCFALNMAQENSITETLMVRWSDDGGIHWSPAQKIAPSETDAQYANSHSVFLPQKNALWCFGPHFLGSEIAKEWWQKKGDHPIHFRQLQMEAWRFDGEQWQSEGIVGDDFWPLGAPVRMENGNWLMTGCDHFWQAAVAISDGENLRCWRIVKPDVDGELFTEATAWVDGNRVTLIARNDSRKVDGRLYAVAAVSEDYGEHFTPCEMTNLPMSSTKAFCGRLTDGRPFLVFNESLPNDPFSRARMLLGIGEAGENAIRRLWVVDEGLVGASGRRLALSYPYAKQIGDKLYLAYSSESSPGVGGNHNDAMLAVIPVSEL